MPVIPEDEREPVKDLVFALAQVAVRMAQRTLGPDVSEQVLESLADDLMTRMMKSLPPGIWGEEVEEPVDLGPILNRYQVLLDEPT